MADTVVVQIVPEVTQVDIDRIKTAMENATRPAMRNMLGGKIRDAQKAMAEQANAPVAQKFDPMSLASGQPDIMTAVRAVSGDVTAIAQTIMGQFNQFIGTLTKFVSVANPAVVEQLSMAFEDINGVIGQTLTPVLQMITPLVRSFGDAVATLIPTSGEMATLMQHFTPLFDKLKEAMSKLSLAFQPVVQKLLAALGPIIDNLGGALIAQLDMWVKVLIPLAPLILNCAMGTLMFIQALTWLFAKLVEFTTWMVKMNPLLWAGTKLAGLLTKDDKDPKKRGSYGAAHRPAEFMGVEEVGRNSYLAAASSGQTVEEQMLDVQKQIAANTDPNRDPSVREPAPGLSR